jgi:hypothetical protein
VGVLVYLVGNDRDLTLEFISWLPDDQAAWRWLGNEVAVSRTGGKLAFRPSKPESFRCGRTKSQLSLRTGTILEGRFPLRKWLLTLLLIADQRCLPKCRVLSEKLGMVAELNQRGTGVSGASNILKSISRARVADAPSWWLATGEPNSGVLPWLLVEWLAKRFSLDGVTKSAWKSWVRRRTPYCDEGGGQSYSWFPEQDDTEENYFRYLVETKPYDIKVQEKLQKRAGKRSRSATWFTLGGLRRVPRELWDQTRTKDFRAQTAKRSRLLPPVAVYSPSQHNVASIVKRFQLRRPFDAGDLERASRLRDELNVKGGFLRKVALIDRFIISGERDDNIGLNGCYVVRAKIPGRPVYFFCSRGDPGQHAYDRLIEDLLYLEQNGLYVLTRCKRFRKPSLSGGLHLNLRLL